MAAEGITALQWKAVIKNVKDFHGFAEYSVLFVVILLGLL